MTSEIYFLSFNSLILASFRKIVSTSVINAHLMIFVHIAFESKQNLSLQCKLLLD